MEEWWWWVKYVIILLSFSICIEEISPPASLPNNDHDDYGNREGVRRTWKGLDCLPIFISHSLTPFCVTLGLTSALRTRTLLLLTSSFGTVLMAESIIGLIEAHFFHQVKAYRNKGEKKCKVNEPRILSLFRIRNMRPQDISHIFLNFSFHRACDLLLIHEILHLTCGNIPHFFNFLYLHL
jgi:hypothetical protein